MCVKERSSVILWWFMPNYIFLLICWHRFYLCVNNHAQQCVYNVFKVKCNLKGIVEKTTHPDFCESRTSNFPGFRTLFIWLKIYILIQHTQIDIIWRLSLWIRLYICTRVSVCLHTRDHIVFIGSDSSRIIINISNRGSLIQKNKKKHFCREREK